MRNKKYTTETIVVIMGVIVVFAAAMIGSWDKLFSLNIQKASPKIEAKGLAQPNPSTQLDFSGNWIFNGNNSFQAHLHLYHSRSDELSGNIEEDGSRISGRITGREIVFTRYSSVLSVPQTFRGYLFEGDHNTMAGLFSHERKEIYGWYAIRQ